MNVKLRIEELVKIINKANKEYYELDNPSITDYEWDMLMEELKDLESKYPNLILANTPTKKIGGESKPGFSKVTHTVKMMSLGDIFSFQELDEFDNKINKSVSNYSYITELKIDGLAISLKYEKGVLVLASTRGDGMVGENITANALTIKDIPKHLNLDINLEVRGECYMQRSVLKRLNEEMLESENEPFKNCRNAAAGTLRQLNSDIVEKRSLSTFIYYLIDPAKHNISSQSEALQFMANLGFSVNPYFRECSNIDEVKKQINEYEILRRELDYDTDGVVIKVNDFNLYQKIGETVKVPKYAIAYKYKPEEVKTYLEDIIFQVGRTGVITPVAILSPVLISGSTVSRASLHNYDYIKEKDIRVNDYVIMRKAGEIIPEVLKVDMNERLFQTPFKMITQCPVCGYPLTKIEVEHYCLNPKCDGIIINGLVHFASKNAMDINTLGEKNVIELYNLGFIKNIPDIYKLYLRKDELIKLDGYGIGSINNLLLGIEESKKKNLDRLLFGLGIKHVGSKISKIILKHYPSFDELINASVESLSNIFEIGPKIGQEVYEYFHNENNILLINSLSELGLSTSYIKDVVITHEFNNLTFVLTGTLEHYKRDEALKIIELRGGKVVGSVSKNTDYVLCGTSPGSKLKKALELGVKTLSEEEFRKKINE
jgi:DNA ligase (NAD+)